jgi:hypothetical protein
MRKRHDWITPAKKLLYAINPYRIPSREEVRAVATLLRQTDEIMQEMSFKT